MPLKPDFSDRGVSQTYRRLRLLVCLALIGMPLAIAGVSAIFGVPLQYSLSDYYFVVVDGGLPRALFIIFLAFLGGTLFAYRGLNDTDNLIHNLAGIFAIGVAIFPMGCDPEEHKHCFPGMLHELHLPSAGLLYLAALASVWYAGGPPLKRALGKLSEPIKWLSELRKIQIFSAVLMTVGIAAFFMHKLKPYLLPEFSWVFWIEYMGFLGFGIYWLRLLLFIDSANKEGRRESKISTVKHSPSTQPVESSPLVLKKAIRPVSPPVPPREQHWVDIP
ncbi:TPA: hypothetical protein ACKRJ1_002530 [Pseudomonas aeruginosa]|nr:hypothetical protein [Pseudomonas aeruginosa]MBG4200012.1 hypothetical protein [Pseudomonas aeruginosa]